MKDAAGLNSKRGRIMSRTDESGQSLMLKDRRAIHIHGDQHARTDKWRQTRRFRFGLIFGVNLLLLVFISAVSGQDYANVEGPLGANPHAGALLSQLDSITPERRATLLKWRQASAAIAAYDANNPATVEAARKAYSSLYSLNGEKNLDNVHWLLKSGEISKDLSAIGAQIRNDMVREIASQMAREYGEVHVMDFSPAENMLNDIDQTFKNSERNREMFAISDPTNQVDGAKLRDRFDELFKQKFGIEPHFLDVASHPYGQRPPDTRAQMSTGEFVMRLVRGTKLLRDNPEAYFLEGAFRMQVDRRSFDSDKPLYRIYTANDAIPGSGVVEVTVHRKQGTIKKLLYRYKPPEIRKGYAWGSAVGNWWFAHQHGGGTRYLAKYGLRSFAEGPGWLTMYREQAAADPDNPPEFESYEDMVEASTEFLQEAFAEHYQKLAGNVLLTFEEFEWAMEKAKAIRRMKDEYSTEAAFRDEAMRLVDYDERRYQENKPELLKSVEEKFQRKMKLIMVHNIERSLPARMADWLAPKVNPRWLGFSDADIENDPDGVGRQVDAFRERLQVSAMHEIVVGLHALDSARRAELIRRMRDQYAVNAVNDVAAKDFTRLFDSLEQMAERGSILSIFGEDSGGRTRVNVGTQEHPVWLSEDDIRKMAIKQHLAEADAFQRIQGLYEVHLNSITRGAPPTVPAKLRAVLRASLDDFEHRWDSKKEEFADSLRNSKFIAITLGTPERRQIAVKDLRRATWEALGYVAVAERAADGELVAKMRWSKDKFIDNAFDSAVTLDNAQSLLNMVKVYRATGGDTDALVAAAQVELLSRLPVAGHAMSIGSILAGKTDYREGAVIVVAMLYPGVGQAKAVYDLTTGTVELVNDIANDHYADVIMVGRLPEVNNTDYPPGLLRMAFRDMQGLRARLLIEKKSADETRKKEIDRLLKRYSLDVDGVKRYVFRYYDKRMDEVLLRNKIDKRHWNRIKLSSNYDAILQDDVPVVVSVPRNIPAVLQQLFEPIARDYFRGGGAFKQLPKHQKAHQSRVVSARFFHAGQNSQDVQRENQQALVAAMATIYALGRRDYDQGDPPKYKWDPNWNTYLHNSLGRTYPVEIYLDGYPAKEFNRSSEEAPDVPSVLDIVPGDTLAEKKQNFFRHFNNQLEAALAKRHKEFGDAPKEKWSEIIFGGRLDDLRPVDPADAAVAHPLLMAFFGREVSVYVDLYMQKYIQAYKGTPEYERRFGKENMPKIKMKVIQQLIAHYKDGLQWELAQHHRRHEEAILQNELARAYHRARMTEAMFGKAGEEIPDSRQAARKWLGLLSGNARLMDETGGPAVDDQHPKYLTGSLDKPLQKAAVEFIGVPTGNRVINADDIVKIQARVKTSWAVQHPLEMKWSLEQDENASASRRQETAKRKHGSVTLQDMEVTPGDQNDIVDVKLVFRAYEGGSSRLIAERRIPLKLRLQARPTVDISGRWIEAKSQVLTENGRVTPKWLPVRDEPGKPTQRMRITRSARQPFPTFSIYYHEGPINLIESFVLVSRSPDRKVVMKERQDGALQRFEDVVTDPTSARPEKGHYYVPKEVLYWGRKYWVRDTLTASPEVIASNDPPRTSPPRTVPPPDDNPPAINLSPDPPPRRTNPPRSVPPRTVPPPDDNPPAINLSPDPPPRRTNPPRTVPPRTVPPPDDNPPAINLSPDRPPRRTNPPRTVPPRSTPPRSNPPRTNPPRRSSGLAGTYTVYSRDPRTQRLLATPFKLDWKDLAGNQAMLTLRIPDSNLSRQNRQDLNSAGIGNNFRWKVTRNGRSYSGTSDDLKKVYEAIGLAAGEAGRAIGGANDNNRVRVKVANVKSVVTPNGREVTIKLTGQISVSTGRVTLPAQPINAELIAKPD